MHIERLTTLAEWLEAGAPHERISFSMKDGITVEVTYNTTEEELNSCKTACCIAGAAVMFFNDGDGKILQTFLNDDKPMAPDDAQEMMVSWDDVQDTALELLDLEVDPLDIGHSLFMGGEFALREIDAPWAARTIRHFIATNEVDWKYTRDADCVIGVNRETRREKADADD